LSATTALVEQKEQEILAPLNEQQRLPAQDFKGSMIVLAGAGSGKTATVVARTKNMINHGIDPYSILLFTFTRKGADEIRERIIAGVGEAGKHVTMGTYHSFCARLLRRHIEKFEIWNKHFTIFDSEDSQKLISEVLSDYKEDNDLEVKAPAAAKTISRWKERMWSPVEAEEKAQNSYEKLVAKIYNEYAKRLRENNAMDFDDLIYFTIRLFERFPEVKAAVNKRWKYITADESQDSSPRDLELLYHLGGSEMNICLVGDDFQAIYGFRGADIDAFFYFVDELNLKKYELGRNYRSTQTVVNAAASLIAKNENQFSKNVFSKNPVGMPIVSYTMRTQKAEAQRVVQIVKAMFKRGVDAKEIAVLYRMSFLSRAVEEEFMANSIPYQMKSGTPFYARKEIKDLLAYLKFYLNPSDQLSLERALTRPKRGIGEKALNKISSCLFSVDCDILSLKDIDRIYNESNFGLRGKAKQGWENFFEILTQIDSLRDDKPSEILECLVALTGYLKFIKDEDPDSFEDRKRNIEELCNIADTYADLEDFVANMTLNEADQSDEALNKVNLMTIHGSKGGEWKAVIVIGCAQGILPHCRSDLEEERRLMYVAMTRAKEYLFLTHPETMMNRGQITLQEPSIFLNEIDPQYIRKQ